MFRTAFKLRATEGDHQRITDSIRQSNLAILEICRTLPPEKVNISSIKWFNVSAWFTHLHCGCCQAYRKIRNCKFDGNASPLIWYCELIKKLENLAIVFGPLLFHQEHDDENRDIANQVTHILLERWEQLGEVMPSLYAKKNSISLADATKLVEVHNPRGSCWFILIRKPTRTDQDGRWELWYRLCSHEVIIQDGEALEVLMTSQKLRNGHPSEFQPHLIRDN